MSMGNNAHYPNAPTPIPSTPSLRITVANPELPSNAQCLIALTEGGMSMCTNTHKANVYTPISYSPLLRITVVNPKHSQNTRSLIALTAGGGYPVGTLKDGYVCCNVPLPRVPQIQSASPMASHESIAPKTGITLPGYLQVPSWIPTLPKKVVSSGLARDYSVLFPNSH